MTLLDAVDPFATADTLRRPDDDPERISAGRYRLPDLTIGDDGELITGDGPRKGGWQRVTTLVKAIGDARALDLWHQRELIKGMVLRPDLYDLACATYATMKDGSTGDLRDALESLADKILCAAGADVGRNLGTAFHGFTEADDLGVMHYARRKWHGKITNYRSGLEAHGLQVIPEYIERKVVILKYGLAGTLDRILRDLIRDVLVIGDLKSQKTFWTWTEIAAQMAAYQMADAMWDRAKRCYIEMPPVASDLAVVAWMPIEHPDGVALGGEARDAVDFFDVDLEKGRKRLDLCAEVDRIRSEDRSKRQTLGLLRPMPAMSAVETYARRLDEVISLAEGSALWGEITARGLAGTSELVELAEEVARRFLPEAG